MLSASFKIVVRPRLLCFTKEHRGLPVLRVLLVLRAKRALPVRKARKVLRVKQVLPVPKARKVPKVKRVLLVSKARKAIPGWVCLKHSPLTATLCRSLTVTA